MAQPLIQVSDLRKEFRQGLLRKRVEAVKRVSFQVNQGDIFGFLGLLWSSLGLVGALQYAYNSVWQVNDRGVKDKVFGLFWLGGAAVLFVGGAAATTALRWLPGFLAPLGVVATMVTSGSLSLLVTDKGGIVFPE